MSERSADSQCTSILRHLQRFPSITDMEALRRYRCRRLAARVYDLRRRGNEISTIMQNVEGVRFARYVLVKQRRAA